MAVKNVAPIFAYGMGDNLVQLTPLPIIATRSPSTSDFAQIGTTWVDKPSDAVYVLTSIVANSANWSTSPASGVGTFTAVTVNPGDLTMTAGDIIISAGVLTVTSGNTTLGGDLTVTGTTTINGDFDLSSAALIDLVSTLNADPAIFLHANGGVLEVVRLRANQGTAVDSIDLVSDVGGITMTAGLASDDAINIVASSGGLDINAALQINIATSENAADAMVLNASAGGIDITAAGAAAEDIDITCTSGSVNISGGEAIATAIVINAGAGGIDITNTASAGLDIDIASTLASVNVSATEDAARAIYVHANGGVSETIQLHSDLGTGVGSIELLSDVGGVTLTATGLASADAINLSAAAGGVDIDGALEVNIASSQAAVSTSISMDASAADGGITMAAGTGGLLFGNQADCTTIDAGNFAPTASRTITVGGGAVVTASVTDTIDIGVDGATTNADSIKVVNVGVGTVTTGENNVNINSGTAASGTQTTNIATGTGGGTKVVNLGNADGLTTLNVDAITLINDSINVNTSVNTGTSTGAVAIGNGSAGAVTLDSGAGISLDAAAASNFSTSGAGIDIDIASASGRVIVTGGEDAAQNIYLHADAGVSETVHIHSDQGTGVASINVASDVGGITLDSGLASADAININSSNAAGGVDIDGGTAGVIIDSTGSVSLDGAAASNFTTTGAGIDLSLISTSGSVNITAGESAANSIVISSTIGGIDITAAGAAAGEDIDILATGSSVNITSTEAVANAIVLDASNASGGIDLSTGGGAIDLSSSGNVTMVPVTGSVAGVSLTLNGRVGVATFTGQTTGAAANVDLTITNSSVTQGQGVLCTVSNIGSNDADITLEGCITETAGTLLLRCQNNGAAALNGDMVATFWLIN